MNAKESPSASTSFSVPSLFQSSFSFSSSASLQFQQRLPFSISASALHCYIFLTWFSVPFFSFLVSCCPFFFCFLSCSAFYFSAQNRFEPKAQNVLLLQFSPSLFLQRLPFCSAHTTVSASFCFVSAFFLFVGSVFSAPFFLFQPFFSFPSAPAFLFSSAPLFSSSFFSAFLFFSVHVLPFFQPKNIFFSPKQFSLQPKTFFSSAQNIFFKSPNMLLLLVQPLFSFVRASFSVSCQLPRPKIFSLDASHFFYLNKSLFSSNLE